MGQTFWTAYRHMDISNLPSFGAQIKSLLESNGIVPTKLSQMFCSQLKNRVDWVICVVNFKMKRGKQWTSEDESEDDPSSATSSSDSEGCDRSESTSKGKSWKRRAAALDFDSLKKHGYKGGPSVLSVPQPQEVPKEDWKWSTGEEHRKSKEVEESYAERQKTRTAVAQGELLTNVQTQKEKKNMSFSQKEKRKRDFGQTSRGKNYVEEEKRLLRDSGVYSGFDT